MTKRILHIVTNVSRYGTSGQPTGLWLSELSHAYDFFASREYEQRLVTANGGAAPLDPRSLAWPHFDASAKAWMQDPIRKALLSSTSTPVEIDPLSYDAIYFTGGHGTMWDFPDNEHFQRITRDIYESGGVVSSVCHGYCGLLNTRLSDGSPLVAGRKVTGYSWVEEVLAGVAKELPYNAEKEMRRRGARYEKGLVPFRSYVVVDDRLVTGQNPASARATAHKVVHILDRT